MMISKALEVWEKKLTKPESKGVFSIERFKDSNLLLAKDNDERIGFIVENTLCINTPPFLKNFEINFHEKLFNKKSKSYHKNCFLVLANKKVNPEFLIRILVGLMERSLTDKITSKDLIGIIKKVSETFDFISNNIQEIIGAWGELYFINYLIKLVEKDKLAQSIIIKSWESVLGRKKIDFSFKSAKIAIEIKTTSKETRLHHISGLDQVKIPIGFHEAFVVSIKINEDNIKGKTCFDLYQSIKNTLKSKELQMEFEERVLVRGLFACKNRDFRFLFKDNLSDSFYTFKNIPKPKLQNGILAVSWNVDFDMIRPIKKSKACIILSELYKTNH
jgi:hypothetical protein